MEDVDIDNQEHMEEGLDNEALEDEIYMMELHKRLVEMKNERKKAETDSKLLNNRLKLLKGEEEKVLTLFNPIGLEKNRNDAEKNKRKNNLFK
jgi:hypothetical protein